MAQIRCPECGCDISEGVSKCPFCECVIKIHNADTGYSGYENGKISNESRLHEDDRALKYKFVAGLFFVLACICFVAAYTRVNNSEYHFHKEHYNQCMSGYADSKYAETTSEVIFKNSYSFIADEYKEMAAEDINKIWEYRWQAIILGVCGAAFTIGGFIFIKK